MLLPNIQFRTQVLRNAIVSPPKSSRKVKLAVKAKTYAEVTIPNIKEIQDPEALYMAARMRSAPLSISSLGERIVDTAFVGPTAEELQSYSKDSPVFVLLHGFDNNNLEFRRLYPLLAKRAPTYAVDLVGWGFTDHSIFAEEPSLTVCRPDKRNHLASFLKEIGVTGPTKRPLVLVGCSIGGSIAIDYALFHPEDVAKLVLIDAQGFIDGIGMLSELPRFFQVLGTQLLKLPAIRKAANKMSYYNKERFATEEAAKIAALHLIRPGWLDANVAFMRGGGYSLSKQISKLTTETLVLWGRQDEILEPQFAERFLKEVPRCKLTWAENCGHLPHVEHPELVAQQLLSFAGLEQPENSSLEEPVQPLIVPAKTA